MLFLHGPKKSKPTTQTTMSDTFWLQSFSTSNSSLANKKKLCVTVPFFALFSVVFEGNFQIADAVRWVEFFLFSILVLFRHCSPFGRRRSLINRTREKTSGTNASVFSLGKHAQKPKLASRHFPNSRPGSGIHGIRTDLVPQFKEQPAWLFSQF